MGTDALDADGANRLRSRIVELETIINRAGALAAQGASAEFIRETLAEAKAQPSPAPTTPNE